MFSYVNEGSTFFYYTALFSKKKYHLKCFEKMPKSKILAKIDTEYKTRPVVLHLKGNWLTIVVDFNAVSDPAIFFRYLTVQRRF